MNQKSITMFKNLLSKTGLTKKFSKYSEGIDNNSNRYLDHSETLYVLSRTFPFIVNIKDKENFINANKMWIALIIENSLCDKLEPYISMYGKNTVQDAIHYLIDNDIWLSPEGIKALKVKQPSNYDGLSDIPSAIAAMKEEKKENPVEVNDTNTGESSTQQKTEAVEKTDELGSSNPPETATELMHECVLAATRLLRNYSNVKKELDVFADYVVKGESIDAMLFRENEELNKKYDQLVKDYEDKVEQVKTAMVRIHDLESSLNKEKENVFQARKERADMARTLDTMKNDFANATRELDILREKVRTSSLPTRKVLKLSELSDLPLVDRSILKSLVPFLEKHGIIVDSNK